MTTDDRFARNLSAWLAEDGAHRVADHLAEVLVHSAATRQRPWWSSPERWLPVDTTLRPRLFNVPSAGRLLAVAMLILVALAITLFAIGSQHRLPPPFGLARNGTFVETRDGDIYATDPATSAAKLLVGGGVYDFGAIFSRDGTKFAFLRSETGRPSTLPGDVYLTMYVADADGSDVHAVTALTKNLDWFEWSPDSTRIAYVSDKRLYVVAVAGGAPTLIKGTGPMFFPTWLPPDGKEIVFRSEGQSPALFAIPADGNGKRRPLSTTIRPNNRYDFSGPAITPDGTRVAFTRWYPDGQPRIHAIDVTTDTLITYPTDGVGQRGALFSPDGSLISYARLEVGNVLQMAVAKPDGSGGERVIGPVIPGTADHAMDANWVFTPDGTAIVLRIGDDAHGTMYLVPIDGSPSRIIESGGYEFVDVQRLAP